MALSRTCLAWSVMAKSAEGRRYGRGPAMKRCGSEPPSYNAPANIALPAPRNVSRTGFVFLGGSRLKLFRRRRQNSNKDKVKDKEQPCLCI